MEAFAASGTSMFPWSPELDALYGTDIIVGRSGKRFENKGSLSTPNNLNLLRAVMMEQRPRRTLEVGLAFGASALTIATCLRDMGCTVAGAHTAIDLAQSSYWDNVADETLARSGLAHLVRTIEKPSAIALASLHAAGERFDFCYIDGSHQFEDVFVDFYFVARMINLRGMVLFDDSPDHHVAKVLRFIRRNHRHAFEEVHLDRYLIDPRLKLRRRIGRAIGRVQLTAFRKKADENASLRFINF